jgi:hypothetical protein
MGVPDRVENAQENVQVDAFETVGPNCQMMEVVEG